MAGHAELADQEQVKRQVEPGRNLVRHRHAAPRQGEDDDV